MQTVYLLTRHRLSAGSFFRFLILLTALATGGVTFANQDSAMVVPQRAVLDFDGDNKTDYAVVRDIGGSYYWFLQRSVLGFAAQPRAVQAISPSQAIMTGTASGTSPSGDQELRLTFILFRA